MSEVCLVWSRQRSKFDDFDPHSRIAERKPNLLAVSLDYKVLYVETNVLLFAGIFGLLVTISVALENL